MSTRTLLFSVDATGLLDGVTAFSLPSPLPSANALGQIVIPVTAATGPLGRLNQLDPVFRSIVGTGGYLLRSAGVDANNPAILQVLVGTRQPDPTITINNGTLFQGDPIHVGGALASDVTGAPYARTPVYVPAGWSLCFRADDFAIAQVGPINIVCEFETLSTTHDAARAIRGQRMPKNPSVLIVP